MQCLEESPQHGEHCISPTLSHTHTYAVNSNLQYSACKTHIVPSMLDETRTYTQANHIQPLLLHTAHLLWRPLEDGRGVYVCVWVCVYGSVRCTAERKLVLIYWCQAGATSYCCRLIATPAWEFKPRERERSWTSAFKSLQSPAEHHSLLSCIYCSSIFLPFPCCDCGFSMSLYILQENLGLNWAQRAKRIHICF